MVSPHSELVEAANHGGGIASSFDKLRMRQGGAPPQGQREATKKLVPPHPALCATFSHEGRRKGQKNLPYSGYLRLAFAMAIALPAGLIAVADH